MIGDGEESVIGGGGEIKDVGGGGKTDEVCGGVDGLKGKMDSSNTISRVMMIFP